MAEIPPPEQLQQVAKAFFGMKRQQSRFSADDHITATTEAKAAAAAGSGARRRSVAALVPLDEMKALDVK